MSDDDMDISSQEFLEFKCPYCNETDSFIAGDAGALQACPFCGQILVVAAENGAPGGAFPLPVNTPRLTLKLPGPEDTGDLAGFMGSDDLFRHTRMTAMDEAGLREWLGEEFRNTILDPGKGLWLGIRLKEPGEVIGIASVEYFRETPGAQPDRQARIFVAIDPRHQRKGFGLETIQGLLGFCFAGIKVRRVTAVCDRRNEAAKALLAKASLRLEGEFYQESFVKNEWIDTSYFALLAEEYRGGV
jgi:RimJ/RimL family protein N-acetyltransferase